MGEAVVCGRKDTVRICREARVNMSETGVCVKVMPGCVVENYNE